MSAAGVYALPVLDRWLVYAPLHDVAAVVNGAAVRALREGALPDADPLGRRLRERPRPAPRAPAGAACPAFLGILPTRGCNLACVYCDFGGPATAGGTMPLRVAAGAVDWMAERAVRAGRAELHVLFFGGEPFVAPEVVDVVVHRTRAQAARHGLVPYLGASTNGCFDDRRCEFVGDYFDAVVLSLDGPAEIHDRHRPTAGGLGSFDRVSRTARQLAEAPVHLCLRACVAHDSVEQLEQIAAWMIESFAPVEVGFESLTPLAGPVRGGLRVPDPYAFAQHWLGAHRVAEQRGVRAVYAAAGSLAPRFSFCPVGTDAAIVSPDGRVSSCYLLPDSWRVRRLDMDLGRVGADGRVRLDRAAVRRVRALPAQKPRCDGCFCRWTCAGGCHVQETYRGCGLEYSTFCLQTRLITAGLLLRELECDSLLDELLADLRALRRLAEQPSDAVAVAGGGVLRRRVGRAAPARGEWLSQECF